MHINILKKYFKCISSNLLLEFSSGNSPTNFTNIDRCKRLLITIFLNVISWKSEIWMLLAYLVKLFFLFISICSMYIFRKKKKRETNFFFKIKKKKQKHFHSILRKNITSQRTAIAKISLCFAQNNKKKI